MNADLQGVGITEYSYLLLISELVQLSLAVALLCFGIGLRKRV